MKTRHLAFLGAALLAVILAAAPSSGQKNDQAELALKAAIKTETVDGDLRGAIEQYKKIVAQPGADRTTVATALLRMGQCHEKLGSAEARAAYERLVRDFADQTGAAAEARARLAALDGRGISAKPAGMAAHRLAEAFADTLGAPSRDGRFLSVVDWATGDLAVQDLATGEMRRLTNKGSWTDSNEFAVISVPSPDGRQVAYAWVNKNGGYDLRVVGIDRSKPRILVGDQEYVQPGDWSPDGKWIPAFIDDKQSTQIVRISVTDGSVQVLKNLGWRYPTRLGCSPDGRYIVYDFPPKEDSPARDIFLLPADGGREIPIVQHPANDFTPAWTPDGKGILFVSDRAGSPGIWLVNLTDGKPESIPHLVKGDVGRFWPMGFGPNESLYYGLQTGMDDVYVASLDADHRKLAAPPTPVANRFVGSNSSPDWSPDGRFLAFASDRSPVPPVERSRTIVIRSLENEQERDITPKLARFRKLLWSADGHSFLVVGQNSKGVEGIFKVDAQSGDAALALAKRPGENLDLAARSADGNRIILVRTVGTVQRVSLKDLATGVEKELPPGVATPWAAISPDDRSVLFRTWEQASRSCRMTVVSAADGTARHVVEVRQPEFIPGFGGLAWSPDGEQIWFTRASPDTEDSFALWRVPFKGGDPEDTGLTAERLRDLRFHPDGRRFSFTAGRPKYEVWVMENFLPALKVIK
jgi:Tol biopolymer transport system component